MSIKEKEILWVLYIIVLFILNSDLKVNGIVWIKFPHWINWLLAISMGIITVFPCKKKDT